MKPQLAFIEAKKTFEATVRGKPFRPVLLGMDGEVAKFRRGPVEMTWRFVDATRPEDVLLAARRASLDGDVLVVPSMSRLGAVACMAYDASWCDGEGRCNVAVRGDGWFETVKSWVPSLWEDPESFFVDEKARLVLGVVAGHGDVLINDLLAALTTLSSPSNKLISQAEDQRGLLRHDPETYTYRFASTRLANATLEMLAMDDDPMMPPDPETSARMARIKSKDTKPELLVRRALSARNVGYVTHDSSLPGTPDIANKSRGWAIFVHGCFWHAHECDEFRPPSRNVEYWTKKFASNRARDKVNVIELEKKGFKVITLWECEINEATDQFWDELADELKER